MSILLRIRKCSHDSNFGKEITVAPSVQPVVSKKSILKEGTVGTRRVLLSDTSGQESKQQESERVEQQFSERSGTSDKRVKWKSKDEVNLIVSSKRDPKEKKKIEDYEIISKLGKGVYASVLKVRKNGAYYAAKKYITENKYFKGGKHVKGNNTKSLIVDISLTNIVNYPYIIKLIDFISVNTDYYTILELGESDLANYLNNNILDYKTKVKFVYQLTQALNYLSYNRVVHCDIKTANIIVKNETVKLIDFGLAYIEGVNNRRTCETPIYKPPERFFSWVLDKSILSESEDDDRDTIVRKLKETSNYYKDNYSKINNDYEFENMELWSYGLIVLEITFNSENAYCKLKGKKWENPNVKKTPRYVFFIDTIYSGANVQKIKDILISDRENREESSDIIDPLIKLALTTLKIDPDERNSYTNILKDQIFDDSGSIVKPTSLKFSFTRNKTKISDYLKKSLLDIYNRKKDAGIFVYQLTDFIIQKHDKYDHIDEKTFLYASILINAALFYDSGVNISTLEDILDIKVDRSSMEDILENVNDIVITEKGNLYCDGIYNYSTEEKILDQSYDLLLEDNYIEYETPGKLVKEAI